jgi:hypothetical protein
MKIPKNIQGRYIKVLRHCLGGKSSMYKVGDYLKVIEDDGSECITAEYAGILHVRSNKHDRTRFDLGDIELMPDGFNPNTTNYEIY